ncbi:MAG TPA: hypothetical protein VMX97_01040, partial [Hyphomicrobiaceae bacterium]|nr:hypothetical protein [Hyphomicrobiaceae bacterium]
MRFLRPFREEKWLMAGFLAFAAVSLVMPADVGFMPSLARWIVFAVLVGLILACAFRALAHAGELGRRLGEPHGSLLLTLSILSIEVSLIVSVMLTGQPDPTMARDTMFAGFMLTMNGVV